MRPGHEAAEDPGQLALVKPAPTTAITLFLAKASIIWFGTSLFSKVVTPVKTCGCSSLWQPRWDLNHIGTNQVCASLPVVLSYCTRAPAKQFGGTARESMLRCGGGKTPTQRP